MSYEIEIEPTQFQCRHIFTDGHRCASPTLRSPAGHEPFCYYHHTTRGAAARTSPPPRDSSAASNNRRSNFTLPLPEDRSSIQLAIGEVLRRIAANEIDSRRAGLLLYGLQIASLNLKNDHKAGNRRHRNSADADEAETVTEITHDPTHGLLAPPAELHANQPLGSAQRFLMELGDVDDEPADIDNVPTPTAQQSSAPQSTEPQFSEPQPSEPQSTAAPGNLLIDLQACAVSSRETIFRMSNFIPKPASPKQSGLGPKAQKLAALREKAAAQANNAAAHTADSTSAAKPKNSVARKTAFQRKAT
jgi:hypothetical protein